LAAGIYRAYASDGPIWVRGLESLLALLIAGAFLIAVVVTFIAPLFTGRSRSRSFVGLLLRDSMAWGIVSLLWGIKQVCFSGFPILLLSIVVPLGGLLFGAICAGCTAAADAILNKLNLLAGISDDEQPSSDAAEASSLSEGIRFLPVDWHIIKGIVVGGIVGLCFGLHLADVSGLEVGPSCLWGLLAGMPVGALIAAFCEASKMQGYGLCFLLALLYAFLTLWVYRSFRQDDWFFVRSYGLTLVGVNCALLALTIGVALLSLNSRFSISIYISTCCLAGFTGLLSAAILAGQVGSELGGPIGQGIGETLGAILGLPLAAAPVVLCFRQVTAQAGLNLREARQWLGFLVIGLANAGVAWLLLS
jgi:hypothetical protein